jgi:hypothetical protein
MSNRNVEKGLMLTGTAVALAEILTTGTGCSGTEIEEPVAPEVAQETAVNEWAETQRAIAEGIGLANEAGNAKVTIEVAENALRQVEYVVQNDLLQRNTAENQKGIWSREQLGKILAAYHVIESLEADDLFNSVSGYAGLSGLRGSELQQSKSVLETFLAQFATENLQAAVAAEFVLEGGNSSQPGTIGFNGDLYTLGDLDWNTVSEGLGLEMSAYQAVARAVFANRVNAANDNENPHVAIQVEGEYRNVGDELLRTITTTDDDGNESTSVATNFWTEIPPAMRNCGYVERDANDVVERVYDQTESWEDATVGAGRVRVSEETDLEKGLMYLAHLGAGSDEYLTFRDHNGDTATESVYNLFDRPSTNGHTRRAWITPIMSNPEATEEYTNKDLVETLESMYRNN